MQQGDAFLVLCVRACPEKDIEEDTVYLWRGPDFEEDEDECGLSSEEFIERVIQQYFGEDATSASVRMLEQEPGDESDEFLNFFD